MLKLSEVDQVLIRFGDTLSPTALSFKVEGILNPQQCAARLTMLLEDPDWLTGAQQSQMVTMKMRQIIVELEDMPRTTRNAEVILQGLERIGNRLDKRIETTQKDLSTLYTFQGAVMLDALQIALGHLRERLSPSEIEVDWEDATESALRLAQIELSKHEAKVDA